MQTFSISKLKLLLLTLFVPALISCSPGNDGAPEETLTTFEKQQFDKLDAIFSEAMNLFPSFSYPVDVPAYIMMRGESDEWQGYFLNPPESIRNSAVAFEDASDYLFDVYREDDFIDEAEEQLGEFGRFDFYFEVAGEEIFLIKYEPIDNFYDDFKDQGNNWLALISTHEWFHIFQFDNWVIPAFGSASTNDYPLDKEQIHTLLYLYDLMDEAHSVTNADEATEMLKEYLVLRNHQIEMDTSSSQAVYVISEFRELVEGSARYIEFFSAVESVYPSINDDPTHGWRNQLDMVSNEATLRQVLAIRTWYHTGAGACHLLNLAGVNLDTQLAAGNPPRLLAETHLNLTGSEKENILQNIMQSEKWESLEQRAEELVEIVESQ